MNRARRDNDIKKWGSAGREQRDRGLEAKCFSSIYWVYLLWKFEVPTVPNRVAFKRSYSEADDIFDENIEKNSDNIENIEINLKIAKKPRVFQLMANPK